MRMLRKNPAVSLPPAAAQPDRARSGPLLSAYVMTLGGIGGIAAGFALYGLRAIVFSVFPAVFPALFAAVGVDPLVRWFQRHRMSRTWAMVTVILIIVGIFVALVWGLLPLLIRQMQLLATAIPAQISQLRAQGWFDQANETSNGVLGGLVNSIATEIRNPAVWAVLGSGVAGFGVSVVNGLASGFFIAILTIYFVATYDSIKDASYKLVSASRRPAFISYTERILKNFGRYISGMVVLAFSNAVYSVILLVIMGVPGAFLIGVVAFFITLIPLIGTILTTISMTILAFIHSPVAGLVVLIFMLIYMQIEACILTPKVMGKAVQIPGSVVLISALAGSTLFGLPGALVAIPISAGIILIIKEVVMPHKQLS
ncbi:AI-2E family transporter [Arthrobacter sp. H35-D1]|uniref:AI-2E family transporter n=1 Tax=Arthrobacter sp. H35-D1 TaxID=3046202 RepID=UPI0024B91E92|nr:AI-2E family transporter [Arthrobacter sp. H35-D1]MDJ0313601.1 AI-2E family transporter [Arthrobacter sp. H35-D1]